MSAAAGWGAIAVQRPNHDCRPGWRGPFDKLRNRARACPERVEGAAGRLHRRGDLPVQ